MTSISSMQGKRPTKAQIDMKINGQTVTVNVTNTDEAEVVARNFISQQGLSEKLQIPLAQKIQQTINKLKPMTESSVVKSILKNSYYQAEPVRHVQQEAKVESPEILTSKQPIAEKPANSKYEVGFIYRKPATPARKQAESISIQSSSNVEKQMASLIDQAKETDGSRALYERLYQQKAVRPSRIPDLMLDDLSKAPIVTDGKVFDRLFQISKTKIAQPKDGEADFKKVNYTQKDVAEQHDYIEKISKPLTVREKVCKPKEPVNPLAEVERVITEKTGPLVTEKLGMTAETKRIVADMDYDFQKQLKHNVDKRNTQQHQFILDSTLDLKLVTKLMRNLPGERKIYYIEACKQRQRDRLLELESLLTRTREEEAQLVKLTKELRSPEEEEKEYLVVPPKRPAEVTDKVLVKKFDAKTKREVYQYQEQKFNFQPIQYAKNEGYYSSYVNKRSQQTADDIIFAAVNGTKKNYDLKDNGFTYMPEINHTQKDYQSEILSKLLYQ